MGGVVSGGASSSTSSRTRVVEVLKKTPFMQMMDDKLVLEIADCFQLVKYSKGAAIKNEPWLFFIVADGSVDISSMLLTKNNKQHLHEVLCQRKVGDYISFAAREQLLSRLSEELQAGRGARSVASGAAGGEFRSVARKNLIAMLDLNRITADAFTGCTLLKLQRDRFLKLRGRLISKHSQGPSTINHTRRFSDEDDDHQKPNHRKLQRRNTMTRPEKIHLINSIIESDLVNFLFDIPFLDGVEQSRLVTLSNLCSYIFIKRGEVLCREGEIGDRFFICIRGTLQATVQTIGSSTISKTHASQAPGGNEKKIQSLKRMCAGAYFGEISLLFKIPRICSITALEDSLLVYIDRVAFCNFLKIVPEATLVLLEHVRLNFMDTLIKQGCAFLNAIPPIKLQELSFISELLEFATNSPIVSRGDKRPGFFLLLRGEVDVEYFPLRSRVARSSGNEEPPVRETMRLKPGGYFGHEAIILNVSSPITVTARDQCLLLKLTPETFFEFFDSMPALYAEFCIKCLRDKARPEHVMQHYDAHKLWAADCVNRRRQHEITLFESIEDFAWEADLAEDRIHELALMVYLKFLAANAPIHVAIRPELLDKIEDDLSSQDVDITIFQGVRNQILQDMEDDSFEAFKREVLFQELLESLRCPQTIYDGLTVAQINRLDMSAQARDNAPLPALEVEDLEEPQTTTEPMLFEAPTATTTVKSSSRRGSQNRYLVATTLDANTNHSDVRGVSMQTANNTRRRTRTDASGLNRKMSATFVF